jgi:hypothetical protein
MCVYQSAIAVMCELTRRNIRVAQDLLGPIRRDFDTTRHFFYFRGRVV